MRWFYTVIVVLFCTATLLFAVQNLQIVTLSLLGFSASVPLALLVALVYLPGMATGGSLLALLRQSIAKSGLRASNRS
jgi:lipopolysaccharide assembly protein A